MGRGLGAGATAGGGSESLRDAEQKTVGPFFTKIRKLAQPPSYGTLINTDFDYAS